jgi:hypothetical protein
MLIKLSEIIRVREKVIYTRGKRNSIKMLSELRKIRRMRERCNILEHV